jgi:hypothetical protein
MERILINGYSLSLGASGKISTADHTCRDPRVSPSIGVRFAGCPVTRAKLLAYSRPSCGPEASESSSAIYTWTAARTAQSTPLFHIAGMPSQFSFEFQAAALDMTLDLNPSAQAKSNYSDFERAPNNKPEKLASKISDSAKPCVSFFPFHLHSPR